MGPYESDKVWNNVVLKLLFTISKRTITGHFEVSCSDLEEHLLQQKSDALIVDVRTPEELISDKFLGKIPESVSVPLDDIGRSAAQQLVQEKRPIVFVCRAGARSAQACSLLTKAVKKKKEKKMFVDLTLLSSFKRVMRTARV
jgi:rhodanese-related sulfurtransferase